MANRADELIDRRRLRRKLTFWRVAALLIAAIAIGVFGYRNFGEGISGPRVNHIAKVKIEGTILADDELLERLGRIGEADSVKGVILSINSPGGTTAGGEAIYEAVRKLAVQKPVTAQVGTLAASAGYMIASATDHIVARQSSIVGSIGVLVQYPDVTGLMDKIGVRMEFVKSSPLKAEPNPFSPTTEEEREMLRSMIMDSYDWFVGLVAERRPLTEAEARRLADGSIWTGRQALDRKLVDALGGEETAVAWLATRGVGADLKVVEWKARRSRSSLLFSTALADRLASALGLSDGGDLMRRIGADRIFLDGLVSLWQPARGTLGE